MVLTNTELATFFDQMAMILHSGISALEGLSIMQEDAATKDADGNESINAKSLNFTATALDNANKTYKIKGFGTTPSQITAELFNPTEG